MQRLIARMSRLRSSAAPPTARDLYLDFMKRCLTNWIYADVEATPFDPDARRNGRDWPPFAHTMTGMKRLDNVQRCVEAALAAGVPGDLMETGVWRGGSTILMRAILKAHQVTDRRVWVADSFRGVPPPNAEQYPADRDDLFYTSKELAVSLDRVKANFAHYGLLDQQVRFIEGWFRDTLPTAPVERLAVLRLDGDMYESTTDALTHLYSKLAVGGYLIVDDYGAIPACKEAVHDYRHAHGIRDAIQTVDWTGVYWRRTGT